MGVFMRVGRLLKPRRASVGLHPEAPGGGARRGPVAIDLHTGAGVVRERDADAELDGFSLEDEAGEGPVVGGPAPIVEKTPRSRQELIAELQRNYQEVLGIVRKVDAHLDEQGERSQRLAEIAERLPAAVDDLGALRAGQGELHAAIAAAVAVLQSRDAVLTTGQRSMLERLGEIRTLMRDSAESERRLLGTLAEFREVMGGMSGATDRLATAVERIERGETERSDRVVEAIRATRSGVYAATIVAGLCAVVALILGFVAVAV
ncbi:MAG: hypothetical protein IT431_04535 [Phycisphaerales bacterium]|nr:hypothetical protein [Phycisphaerales bacterium]